MLGLITDEELLVDGDFTKVEEHTLFEYLYNVTKKFFPNGKHLESFLHSNGAVEVTNKDTNQTKWKDECPDDILAIVGKQDWQQEVAILEIGD